ncbi:MAG: putative 2-dehydropantoate 2-reductase [Cyanobacteria bacterium J069]|nr:MAG: putative 2-dehydropantoate 2-reductase [Cyanobacteria bacterium J069]
MNTASGLTYAILGTGALGGYYGACLQKAGLEVHYLLRSDYAHVKQHGLIVETPDGDFRLPQVNAYQSVQDMPRCDVVVVALKTTQNHLLPDLLPPVVKDEGVVLVLQNGLGVEAAAAAIAGAERILGGLCFLCSNKVGPGHIRHLDYKKIAMGEYSATGAAVGITERLRRIAADFEQAGIPIELAADLVLARWKKLMWNIPFNGLSVVLNATTQEMMANPDSLALAEALMREVMQGAAAQGRAIAPEFVQTMLVHTAEMQPYRTSMKIDYDEQRPLEVEAMYGSPLRAAQAAGVQLPQIQTLYQQLRFLDAQNRSSQRQD